MKTTPKLISGEMMIVTRQLKKFGSISRMYSKAFYDKHFVKALGRQLMYKDFENEITVSETDEDYILKVE